MTRDDEELAGEWADAVLTALEVGQSDYVCRGCGAAVLGGPVLACPCGCEAILDRVCDGCGWPKQAVRRQ